MLPWLGVATDTDLLLAWREGDKRAGSELFTRHVKALTRFFHNKIPSQTQDALQKTFTVCVESRDKIPTECTFRAYLFGVARNVLRNQVRALARAHDRFAGGITSACDADPSPSRLAVAARDRRHLLEALRRLPLDLQIALELFYWEDLTGDDLARVLDVPVGTVRTRLRRARQLLETTLSELVESPEQLDETLTRLDDWARELRGVVAP